MGIVGRNGKGELVFAANVRGPKGAALIEEWKATYMKATPCGKIGNVAVGIGLTDDDFHTSHATQAPSPPLPARGGYIVRTFLGRRLRDDTSASGDATRAFVIQALLLLTVLRGRQHPVTETQHDLRNWRAALVRANREKDMPGVLSFCLASELDEAVRLLALRDVVTARIEALVGQTQPRGQRGTERAAEPVRLAHTRDWLRPHAGPPERQDGAVGGKCRPPERREMFDGVCMSHGRFRSTTGHCPFCVVRS